MMSASPDHQQRVDEVAGLRRRDRLDAEDVAVEQAAIDRVVEVLRRSGSADAAVLLAGSDQFDKGCPSIAEIALVENLRGPGVRDAFGDHRELYFAEFTQQCFRIGCGVAS